MKRFAIVLSMLAVFCVATGAFAINEEAICKNVDFIVAGLDGGNDPMDFKADAFDPYTFIMEEGGKMIVHPSLTGESLKEKAPAVYDALMVASAEGVWIEYEWKGKVKHTYAKKTKTNLIVGSGY